MSSDETYLPFSQRNGLAPIPPQLNLCEVSAELRRLIEYSLIKEMDRYRRYNGVRYVFSKGWDVVAADFHVNFLKQRASSFANDSKLTKEKIGRLISESSYEGLFDLVEFFARHPNCSSFLRVDLADAFKSARAAYRIIDNQIVAIGTQEEAGSFERAISMSESTGALASRKHLIGAGMALRSGNWADSVRESIHAVEAAARRVNPNARTLGEALKILEKSGYIHGSLKSAFEKLYGYTNDEDGIRHALSDSEARVDEVDALFMLGACASFVSYLIARHVP